MKPSTLLHFALRTTAHKLSDLKLCCTFTVHVCGLLQANAGPNTNGSQVGLCVCYLALCSPVTPWEGEGREFDCIQSQCFFEVTLLSIMYRLGTWATAKLGSSIVSSS